MNTILTLCLFACTITMAQAQTNSVEAAAKPITIGKTIEIKSAILSETRTLNIYLPERYGIDDTVIHYPVIYLLDGGLDEDFVHVAGLVQFNSQPWVNRLPQSIVVGIANTDRKRDMTFPSTAKKDKELLPTAGGAAQFIAFIEKELQPYIKEHYSISGSRTIIGESLAGLLATEILMKKPSLFDTYIIISPSLWWDNGLLLKQSMSLSAAAPSRKTNVYIGVGKEGLAPSAEPHVMEVDANVLAEKIRAVQNKNINLHFDYLPGENHATVAHQALLNAFKMLNSL